MTINRSLAIAPLLFCLLAAAQAQRVAPGLWEHTMTTAGAAGGQLDAQMAQMQQEMAAMPPEQRKMVEAMMAKQGVAMNGRSTSVKVCVTKEQAARDEFPHERNCSQQSMQREGNTVRFKFACTGSPPSSGEGEFTLDGEHAYRGRTRVDTVVEGRPERVEMQMTGKWLGADCGSIQPRP